jgi:hypothetical protein
MASCKYCGKDIFWMKDGRKNVPHETEGAVHECESMKKSLQTIKTFDRTSLPADVIAEYERAMNEAAANKKDKKKDKRY